MNTTEFALGMFAGLLIANIIIWLGLRRPKTRYAWARVTNRDGYTLFEGSPEQANKFVSNYFYQNPDDRSLTVTAWLQ